MGQGMKYLIQFTIIMTFVFLGEGLAYLIPFPIAGSVYGMILLFLALVLGVVKLAWVADIADFFHSIMGLFFIAPAVAIIDIWADISDVWPILVVLLVLTYLVSILMTGVTTQSMINKFDKKSKENVIKIIF